MRERRDSKAMRKKGFVDNKIDMLHRNLRDRIDAFENYGGAKCACCDEIEFSFLSLDHIDGAGNSDRIKLLGSRYRGGHELYRKLRLTGYPAGYQVLCMNCQVGRRDKGHVCPHKSARLSASGLLMEFEKLRVGKRNYTDTQSAEYKTALGNVMRKARPRVTLLVNDGLVEEK